MAVGEQDPIEAPEAGAAAQQLTLGALSTIHQDTLTTGLDEKPGMVAFDRRHAGRGPEKRELEHEWGPGASLIDLNGRTRSRHAFADEGGLPVKPTSAAAWRTAFSRRSPSLAS